jgi:tetratricopeptide (TPR) repeat protein
MPTPNTNTLSPAELAKLEHAFATDPSSNAYKALAQAYLAMSRYMEAMVVCKKGVKAHPQSSEPRLLLARVYAEQGKDKKALDELTAALLIFPSDKLVLRTLGALQMRVGEPEAGRASLLKAFQIDPADEATAAALKEWNVALPAPAAPAALPTNGTPAPFQTPAPAYAAGSVSHGAHAAPAPYAPGAVPQAGPVQPVGTYPAGHARSGPNGVPHAGGAPAFQSSAPTAPQGVPPGYAASIAPEPVSQHPAPGRGSPHPGGARPAQPSGPRTQGVRSAARPAAVRRPHDEDEDFSADHDAAGGRRARKAEGASRSKSTSKNFFFKMLIIAPLCIGIYALWGQWQVRRNREIKKHLDVATEQLKHDSYASYKKACEAADHVLGVDGDSVAAHGYLAYAWTIRWGEHGGGDDARKKAEEHLQAAREGDDLSSHLYAAEALFKTYSGKGTEALAELKDRIGALDAQGKRSSLLSLTLGLIQTSAGDLDGAGQSLDRAQALAPDDPRVYAALGTLYRRRGQDNQAWRNYDFALRYEKDHPESLLGKALLMLEQDDAQYYGPAARMIKKLVEADPPPSPRQLATAHLARAFLISRVSNDLQYYPAPVQKELLENTAVPADKRKAAEDLAKAEEMGFSLDRQNPELHLIKGRRLMMDQQIDAAVQEIRAAIKTDASRAQFYVELARALMKRQGGEKEAQEALVTAIRTMGKSPKLLLMLGDAYQRQGQLDRALEQFRLAIGDGKSLAPEARLAAGGIYREKKDWTNALDQLERAAQEFVSQPSRVAAAYTELGRAYEEKGDRDRAGETYQKAIKADADYADVYYFFGRYLGQDRASAGKGRLAAQQYLKLAPKGAYAADAQRLLH